MNAVPPGTVLRACVVCGKKVVARPYQSNAARACRPSCAQTLAMRENPDLKQHALHVVDPD